MHWDALGNLLVQGAMKLKDVQNSPKKVWALSDLTLENAILMNECIFPLQHNNRMKLLKHKFNAQKD